MGNIYNLDVIRNALREDISGKNGRLSTHTDITAMLIDEDKLAEADLYCNDAAVLAGTKWFNQTFAELKSEYFWIKHDIKIEWLKQDGDMLQPDDKICHLLGNARTLLAGERTALNFLQTLSGTATISAQFAAFLGKKSKTQILDTRKTIPGLREAQRDAVRIGGCHNHRFGLDDAMLIKENHIAMSDGLIPLLRKAAEENDTQDIIVEVETIEQFTEILEAGGIRVDVVMLDNFTLEQIKEALKLRKQYKKKALKIEVSGGVNQHTINDLIEIGVDRISLGALTKHCQAIDFSMRFK